MKATAMNESNAGPDHLPTHTGKRPLIKTVANGVGVVVETGCGVGCLALLVGCLALLVYVTLTSFGGAVLGALTTPVVAMFGFMLGGSVILTGIGLMLAAAGKREAGKAVIFAGLRGLACALPSALVALTAQYCYVHYGSGVKVLAIVFMSGCVLMQLGGICASQGSDKSGNGLTLWVAAKGILSLWVLSVIVQLLVIWIWAMLVRFSHLCSR